MNKTRTKPTPEKSLSTEVRTYVLTYVLPWTAISQKCMDQIV